MSGTCEIHSIETTASKALAGRSLSSQSRKRYMGLAASGSRAQAVGVLSERDGEGRDAHAIGLRQTPGRGAVACADVAHGLARLKVRPRRYVIDELPHGYFGWFLARAPEAMMDVLAPDFPVEHVEFVVMPGHVGAGGRALRVDHWVLRIAYFVLRTSYCVLR